MCKLCKTNPVYEFTNKRKLCKKCFINYFQKKILYTVRKFNMIRRGDAIKYKKDKSFKGVVLEEMLKFIADKAGIKLNSGKANKIAIDASIDSEAEKIVKTLINGNVSEMKEFLPVYKNTIKPLYLFLDEEILLYATLKNLKFKKSKEDGKQEISHSFVKAKRKKNKISDFINNLEKKHPEVKRAIINSILELYN